MPGLGVQRGQAQPHWPAQEAQAHGEVEAAGSQRGQGGPVPGKGQVRIGRAVAGIEPDDGAGGVGVAAHDRSPSAGRAHRHGDGSPHRDGPGLGDEHGGPVGNKHERLRADEHERLRAGVDEHRHDDAANSHEHGHDGADSDGNRHNGATDEHERLRANADERGYGRSGAVVPVGAA